MRFLLLSVPTPILVLVIVGGSALLAGLATQWVRTHFDERVHQSNNEVAGFIFAAVAVIYGVLLAFMVLVVWQSYEDAQANTEQESVALVDIYRLGQEIADPFGSQIRALTEGYARDVIGEEWNAMANAQSSSNVQATIEELWNVHRALDNARDVRELHNGKLLDALARLGNYRRVRLLQSRLEIPPLLWALLIGGAVVTIGFTLFFRAPNWRAHLLMTAMFAGLVAFVLLLIVELDDPFVGNIKVTPLAFQQALEIFEKLRER